MLDLVQHQLVLNGFIFARIDGQSSLQKRSSAIFEFSNNPMCMVMLASIGSAGEGYVICLSRLDLCRGLLLRGMLYSVNLTAANHVHLLEPHWNPMVEAQAVDRVHRMGQTRSVLTTRYITRDSIETVSLLKPGPLHKFAH